MKRKQGFILKLLLCGSLISVIVTYINMQQNDSNSGRKNHSDSWFPHTQSVFITDDRAEGQSKDGQIARTNSTSDPHKQSSKFPDARMARMKMDIFNPFGQQAAGNHSYTFADYFDYVDINEGVKDKGYHTLGVIVPYRNASRELEQFLPHMESFLENQGVKHHFYVVEQIDDLR